MKRVGRIFVTVLILLTILWGGRAIYLYRIWVMARTWAKIPSSISPSPWAFLLPETYGTTYHGIVTDIAFLRIQVRPTDKIGSDLRDIPRVREAELPTVSNTPPNCGNVSRFQLRASKVTPVNLPACYGVPPLWEAKPTHVFAIRGISGGCIVQSGDNTLSLAIYRTR